MSLTCAICVAAVVLGMAVQNRTLIQQAMVSRAANGGADIVPVRAWNGGHSSLDVEAGTDVERLLRRTTWMVVGLAAFTVAALVLVLAHIRRLSKQLAEARQRLELLATTDWLSGLCNRKYVTKRLAEEISRQRRNRAPLSCAIIDIDHFKRVNDTLGHAVGDSVLKEVASVLESTVRNYDTVGRYGGDEFLAIFPGLGLSDAGLVCERLRQRVAECVHADNREDRRITVSVGYSVLTRDDTVESVILRADEALYRAKDLGRNRAEAWTW